MNEITLTLDQNDLAVIAQALGEMPLKFSKATFDKINAQVAQAHKTALKPAWVVQAVAPWATVWQVPVRLARVQAVRDGRQTSQAHLWPMALVALLTARLAPRRVKVQPPTATHAMPPMP